MKSCVSRICTSTDVTCAGSATAALVVRVEDVADSPPEFVVVPPVTRIPEDLAAGTQIMKGGYVGVW